MLGALTLAENVCLPLSEHLRLTKQELRTEAIRVLRMVGLGDFADYYPNELSGGMRKRAGLARAIIAEPKLLLCDEPTSGLDPITAARMDDLLLSMHRHYPDMTIVVVSHDLASLKRIADQVLVLRDGVSLYCGDLNGLEKSQDPYLVQFLHREPGPEEEEAGELMQPSGQARSLAQALNKNAASCLDGGRPIYFKRFTRCLRGLSDEQQFTCNGRGRLRPHRPSLPGLHDHQTRQDGVLLQRRV